MVCLQWTLAVFAGVATSKVCRRGVARAAETPGAEGLSDPLAMWAEQRREVKLLTTETLSFVSCTRYFCSLKRCVSGSCPATMGSACDKAVTVERLTARRVSVDLGTSTTLAPVRSGLQQS